MPGYFGVDTVYHDQQHTLDITLATARLIVGHEMQVPEAQKFGPERAMLGIVVALFHDVGYLRTTRDTDVPNGAEFTTVHVSRGAAFLTDYLPKINLGQWAKVAAEIIHYTGYERPFKNIVAPDPRDHKLGHLVGTADLMAQMADRCYLEKCRDRLYAEFVLAGVALPIGENGHVKVRYASGLDLLRQTPKFVFDMRAKRLDGEFNRAYRYLEVLYKRPQPVHGIHRPQPRVPAAHPAQRELAPAAASAAGVHRRRRLDGHHAHAHARARSRKSGVEPSGEPWRQQRRLRRRVHVHHVSRVIAVERREHFLLAFDRAVRQHGAQLVRARTLPARAPRRARRTGARAPGDTPPRSVAYGRKNPKACMCASSQVVSRWNGPPAWYSAGTTCSL